MTTHAYILAWRIPWTEEPAGLPSMGSQSLSQLSTHEHLHQSTAGSQTKVHTMSSVSDFNSEVSKEEPDVRQAQIWSDINPILTPMVLPRTCNLFLKQYYIILENYAFHPYFQIYWQKLVLPEECLFNNIIRNAAVMVLLVIY